VRQGGRRCEGAEWSHRRRRGQRSIGGGGEVRGWRRGQTETRVGGVWGSRAVGVAASTSIGCVHGEAQRPHLLA
jgi:hypothetical protein